MARGKTLVLLGALVGTTAFAGNFAQDYQAAAELNRKGKRDEAKKAYLELLERKERRHKEKKKDVVHQALAFIYLGEKNNEKAQEHLDKIQDEFAKKNCRIEILRRQRKGDDILAMLKDEDLTTWPDRFIYTAAVNRGSLMRGKDPQAAEKDLTLALKYTVDARQQGRVYMELGELYENQLNDQAKAVEWYEKAVAGHHLTKRMKESVKERIAKLKAKEPEKQAKE